MHVSILSNRHMESGDLPKQGDRERPTATKEMVDGGGKVTRDRIRSLQQGLDQRCYIGLLDGSVNVSPTALRRAVFKWDRERLFILQDFSSC